MISVRCYYLVSVENGQKMYVDQLSRAASSLYVVFQLPILVPFAWGE